MLWYLYLVEHPMGVFIGVARSEGEVREHFGTRVKLTPLLTDTEVNEAVLNLRESGKERIFLAW
jgi:hypothetical protein